jgi:TldD protein
MSARATAERIFFSEAGFDRARAERIMSEALKGGDDGELFLEHRVAEALVFDDGRLKTASFDATQGFGLRSVAGEAVGYGHASEISEAALKRAAEAVKAVGRGRSGTLAAAPSGTNRVLYRADDPLSAPGFETKVKLLEEMNAYARAKDARVRQVSLSLVAEWRVVAILRPDADLVADVRPLVRLSVSVVAGQGDRQESGSSGAGGRVNYDTFIDPANWKAQVDEAIRQAAVNLESVPAPAGEMEVVLAPGWPGILLHEAIGHGLEGDFNRKKTSAFSGLLGTRVAAPGVTVVDDGTIPDRRGSITVDDEGTPSSTTVLIEDGILKGYIQDRLNARLMGVKSTGNGRRQSFAHRPMPRMTNTYMLAGKHAPEEIIKSVKRGLYAVHFGGGQVDITSGKFVFSASEAYLVEDGRIGPPVKGATLIGNGPDSLTKVAMVGNDMALDPGIGTCGKDGQSVPVGVGQPTLKLSALTVGGTAQG